MPVQHELQVGEQAWLIFTCSDTLRLSSRVCLSLTASSFSAVTLPSCLLSPATCSSQACAWASACVRAALCNHTCLPLHDLLPGWLFRSGPM